MTKIPSVEADGRFENFENWVNSATFAIGGTNALCVDALDRICAQGSDFMRARDEGKFPVRYYFGAGEQTEAQQRKSAVLANRMLHGKVGMRIRRYF